MIALETCPDCGMYNINCDCTVTKLVPCPDCHGTTLCHCGGCLDNKADVGYWVIQKGELYCPQRCGGCESRGVIEAEVSRWKP